MSSALLVTALYLAVVLAVGFISSARKKGGAHEFFLAGRQLSWVLLLPLLAAEYISGGTTVGIAEKLHKSGITGFAYYVASPIGLVMLAYGFAKFFQRIKKVTIGETVHLLFGHRTRVATIIILLLLYPMSTCTAAIALATTVGPIFGVSYEVACWSSAAFLVILAIVGLRGQAWMNVVHFVTIMFCFIPLAIASVGAAGGLGNILSSLPAGHLNFMADGFGTIVSRGTSAILIKLIALSAITAMFAAKSENDAKIGAIGTGVFLLMFVSLPGIIGLAAYVLDSGIASKDALWFMSENIGEWATVLASVGVLAAIISTTPAMLLGLGALATRDVFMLFKPDATDRAQIMCCRLAIVFFGFAGTAMAMALTKGTTILDLSFRSVAVRTIITIPILVSILWRRVHPTAAFYTILLGGISGAIWTFAGAPYGLDPMWPAMGVGGLTLVIVSLLRKPSMLKGADGLVEAVPGSTS